MIYQVFIISFIVSYLGSIPPGTLNITTMQLAVQDKKRAAVFFSLAASLVEFVYTGVTVRFQIFLSEQPTIMENFYSITAFAMIILGVANIYSHSNSKSVLTKTDGRGRSGFKRGLVLGIFNPLTVPFWLAVTAYLQTHHLIHLEGNHFWVYLMGISSGTFVLLLTVSFLGGKFTSIADNRFLVHKLPGFIFIGLGIYNFIVWWFF